MNGRILAWMRGATFAFTWEWKHEPLAPHCQVEIHFKPSNKGTQLQLAQGPYEDSPEEEIRRQEHLQGWTHFLGHLKDIRFKEHREGL